MAVKGMCVFRTVPYKRFTGLFSGYREPFQKFYSYSEAKRGTKKIARKKKLDYCGIMTHF